MTLTLVNPLFVKNTSRESFQIWSKRSFRLTEDLIRSQVSQRSISQNSLMALSHDLSSLSSGKNHLNIEWLKEKLIRFQWSKHGYSNLMSRAAPNRLPDFGCHNEMSMIVSRYWSKVRVEHIKSGSSTNEIQESPHPASAALKKVSAVDSGISRRGERQTTEQRADAHGCRVRGKSNVRSRRRGASPGVVNLRLFSPSAVVHDLQVFHERWT